MNETHEEPKESARLLVEMNKKFVENCDVEVTVKVNRKDRQLDDLHADLLNLYKNGSLSKDCRQLFSNNVMNGI